MPTWLLIVVAVVVGLVVLLAIGGMLARARFQRSHEGEFAAQLDAADRALAAAHAQDKGWERGALESAARRAFDERRPGVGVREMALVQVEDRPGTEEDRAVFRLVTEDGAARLTLARERGGWALEQLD